MVLLADLDHSGLLPPQMPFCVDRPGFYSLQFTPSSLSAFPFSGGIKKMAPNCLQNKTAALSLELDKDTSKTGTGIKKWRVGGIGGEVTIKSHQTQN